MNSMETSIPFDLILPSLIAANHKQLISHSAREISKLIGIKERILAERLLEREKESPSAIGDGIAITHLHISGLKNSVNVLLRLRNPIPMNAADKQDVDIVCYLLTPEREGTAYLRNLARLSRLLRNADICHKLRTVEDEKSMRAVLEQHTSSRMAA